MKKGTKAVPCSRCPGRASVLLDDGTVVCWADYNIARTEGRTGRKLRWA